MSKGTKSKYVNVRYFLSHWNYRKKEEKRMERVCFRVVLSLNVKLDLFNFACMTRNKTEEKDYI